MTADQGAGRWHTVLHSIGMGAIFVLIVASGSIRVLGGEGQFHDSDFDAFRAAQQVQAEGMNPYLTETIDLELQKGAPRYSDDFAKYPGAQTRSFFNPPMWLTMLTAIGFSSSVLVLGGAFATGAAIGAFSVGSSIPFTPIIIPLSFLMWDRLFLWANDELGQTGYLIAASMLWSVWLSRRNDRLAGAVGSLLSGKPHIWLAHILGSVRGQPRLAVWQVGVSALIGLGSIVQFGPTLWFRYAEALTQSHGDLPVEQGLTFTALGSIMRTGPAVAVTALLAIVAVAGLIRAPISAAGRWVLIVALVMLASTHAFWHDWAWLLGVPLILRWGMVRSLAFYLSIPLVAELALGSAYSNSAPVLVVSAWLGVVLFDGLTGTSKECAPTVRTGASGSTLLSHGQ